METWWKRPREIVMDRHVEIDRLAAASATSPVPPKLPTGDFQVPFFSPKPRSGRPRHLLSATAVGALVRLVGH
jgi:hypothetical protein